MNLRTLMQRLEMPLEGEAPGSPAAPAAAPDLSSNQPGSAPTPATAEALESHIDELLADDAEHNGATPATPVVTTPASHVTPPPSAPVAPTSPVATPPAEPPAAPATPPQAPTAPVTPGQPPAQPAAPVTPPVTPAPPAQPPAPPADPEVRRAEAQRRREAFTQSLEKAYEVPETERERINLNPSMELPKLAAKLHVSVLEAATEGLAAVIPQIVEQVIQRRETASSNERDFYAAWPQLDRSNPKHHQTVQTLLGTIVSMNPQISKADAIKQAGAAALVALGVPYEKAPTQPSAPPTFAAAAPGAGGPAVPAVPGAPDKNPFSQLSREFEEDL